MATWNPPSDSAIAQDKAIKATDIRAIRDLSTAMAEGASGATRMGLGFLPEIAAGDDIKVAMDTDVASANGLVFRCGIFQTGSVRIKVQLSTSANVQIYANSSASGGTTVYNASSASVTQDYTITDPRIIEVYVLGGTATVQNIYLGTTGAFILPFSGYNIDAVFGPT